MARRGRPTVGRNRLSHWSDSPPPARDGVRFADQRGERRPRDGTRLSTQTARLKPVEPACHPSACILLKIHLTVCRYFQEQWFSPGSSGRPDKERPEHGPGRFDRSDGAFLVPL